MTSPPAAVRAAAILLLAAAASPATAAGPAWRTLRPGLSVEVEGTWKPARGFVADEIDVHETAPDESVRLVGPLQAVDAGGRSVDVLGARVDVPAGCRVRDASGADVALASLAPGTWVKIAADFSTERLAARRVTALASPADALEVEGAIQGIDTETRVLRIGGVPVQLSRDTEVQGAGVVDVLFAVDDDDASPALVRALGGRVRFGGRMQAGVEPEGNFDLNPSRAQDVTESSYTAELQVDARPSRAIEIFGKGGVSAMRVLVDEEGDEADETDWRLQQLFAVWRPPFARWAALQVGRQDFDEPREWLYDENLDAVRLHARRGPTRAEASVSTRFGSASRMLEDWTNFVLALRRDVASGWIAETYAIHRRLRDDAGNRPLWLGARSEGRLQSGLRHWLELSWLDGRMEDADKHAWAVDAGLRVRLHRASRLSVTAGWAIGSGGSDPGDRFRQTGLQDNNDKFGGVASFRYYGELFDPELSNLSVGTLGAGFRPTHDSSIDVVVHRYAQVHAERALSSNVDARPRGLEKDLGFEWDLILAFEEIPWLDLEYDFALFEPGDAFGPRATRATFHSLIAKFDF